MENETMPQYIKIKGEKGLKRYNEFAIFRINLKVLMTFNQLDRKGLSQTIGARSLKRIDDLCEGRVPPKFDEIVTLSGLFGTTIDQLLYKKVSVTFN